LLSSFLEFLCCDVIHVSFHMWKDVIARGSFSFAVCGVILNVLSRDVCTYCSTGLLYANRVAICNCNCIQNFHFYNDIWVVKLFVCYCMIIVLLPF
jgi:hypothetical protein